MSKIQNLQNQKNPITCLTAYTYPIAKILDKYCDVILVGDSLGMAIYGMENTLGVSVEMMINHGKAVMRGAKKALVVIDIPFGSFEEYPEQALETAQKIIRETNCDAVKIETSKEMIATVKFLVDHGIPVMGHIGLLPQKVIEMGGYKYQGKDQNSAAKILQIAKDLEKAGAFATVIEAVPASLADQITKTISIPTIGIGASVNCSGQVLVIDDILGLNQDFKPRFVKNYTNLTKEIDKAVEEFCEEVRNKKFPGKEQMV
jgi:3-methyl-2-oxobutanoate hydroxymethyltransferase